MCKTIWESAVSRPYIRAKYVHNKIQKNATDGIQNLKCRICTQAPHFADDDGMAVIKMCQTVLKIPQAATLAT